MNPIALLIAKNWPEPASTAAGRRTLDLLQLVQEAGYHIHVASPAEYTPFQADLTGFGYETHRIAVNDSAAERLFEFLAPTLVIYDQFVMEEQFSWRIKKVCPDALTLLDTSDLHCLRAAREQALKRDSEPDLFNDTAIREISAIFRCDLTVMISTVEIDLLKQHFGIPDTLLFHLPFLVKPTDIKPGLPLNERRHLISIGGFKHAPNRDAVHWLKSSIWPQIRQHLPNDVEMHIVGAYADHAINQLNNPKERFLIKGRVENALFTLGQYRLNLAPLRFGAGQKGKILESWLTSTPTLSTPIGFESMAERAELGYSPSSDPEVLAKQAIRAYQEDNFANRLIRHGSQILQRHFLYDNYALHFQRKLQTLTDTLSQHRHNNFYGRLLWQNQFRASEFMSRWIELKNQIGY